MQGPVAAIILAAGESKRMGMPKLLLPFAGSTIIETTVRNVVLSEVDQILVVTGYKADRLSVQLQAAPVRLVLNKNYQEGMLQSVIVGIQAVSPRIGSVMVMPADQPMIKTSAINKVLAAFQSSPKGIAVPTYRMRRGHPILFCLKYRTALIRFINEGLRRLVYENPEDVLEIPIDDPEICNDIDTFTDYRQALDNVTPAEPAVNSSKISESARRKVG